MKSEKATVPDDIVFELKNTKTLWPSEFFNRIIQKGTGKKTPHFQYEKRKALPSSSCGR